MAKAFHERGFDYTQEEFNYDIDTPKIFYNTFQIYYLTNDPLNSILLIFIKVAIAHKEKPILALLPFKNICQAGHQYLLQKDTDHKQTTAKQ